MFLTRAWGKIRRVRTGLTLIARVYDQDPNPFRLTQSIWFVTTREGLIGLRRWLVNAALDVRPVHAGWTLNQAKPGPSIATPSPNKATPAPSPFQDWLQRYDLLGKDRILAAKRHLATIDLPEILILAIITRDDLPLLDRILTSWEGSIHPAWKAVIIEPKSFTAAESGALQLAIAKHNRISIVTSADALDSTREQFKFTLISFGATMLNELSLYMFLEAVTRTGAAAVYSDHDTILVNQTRVNPAFKPQFSPEYLARFNYIGDCLLISRAIAWMAKDSAGFFDLDSLSFDRVIARIILQASAQDQLIEHLPFALFHVLTHRLRPTHDLPEFETTGPRVSIIIPSRDGLAHLRPCIESILIKTSYDLKQIEIVIIDNHSINTEMLAYLNDLAALPNFVIIKHPAAFNFAEINNIGAAAATGEILVFLNDDMLVHDPAWLSKLAGYAQQLGVGAVGAKLLFPDGRIQHGGCVAGGSMGTIQHLLSFARPEDVSAIDHNRELSVVTGACIAMRKDVFQVLGGFDPVLRITWNDAKLCLSAMSAGLRNMYIADPLLIHDESTTRGHDDTIEKYTRYFSEADYTRRRYRDYFYDDPSYNPNLSLECAGERANPPRVRFPWFRQPDAPASILVLSVVYKFGYGVSVVIQQQVRKLIEKGYNVVIGGPAADGELSFPGCERVTLNSAKEAAVYSFTHGIALIVSHTPPFFEIPILIGGHIPVLTYDYGEPAAEFFPDPTRAYLINVGLQKRGAAALTTTIAAISQSVKDEMLNKDALVIGLANSHLPSWSEAFRQEREDFREKQGWNKSFIVLTVCRFHENERAYKGLDKIASILNEFPYLFPDHSGPLYWFLAGAGTPTDIEQAEALGFKVFPNVSDAMLADLYKAADAYMSFSKWEGYNLGISQALAMGLPTLGSDIPAHREFGICTTNSVLNACHWLDREIDKRIASKPGQRIAKVIDWDSKAEAFEAVIDEMLQNSAVQKLRGGASGRIWKDFAVTAP